MAKELWAVQGDENNHGHGAFKEPSNKTVFINKKPVIVKGDHAYQDDLCGALGGGGEHCDPKADGTSGTVYAYKQKIHRNNDTRSCGAKTIVSNQSKVFSG